MTDATARKPTPLERCCPNCSSPMIANAFERGGAPNFYWLFQWDCIRCGATLTIESAEMRPIERQPRAAPPAGELAEAVKWAMRKATVIERPRIEHGNMHTAADDARYLRILATAAERAGQEQRAGEAVARLRDLLAKATPGHWRVEPYYIRPGTPDEVTRGMLMAGEHDDFMPTGIIDENDMPLNDSESLSHNLDLIVAMHEELPMMLRILATAAERAGQIAEKLRALVQRWQALACNADEGVKDAEPGGMTSFILSSAAGTFRDCAADVLRLLEDGNA